MAPGGGLPALQQLLASWQHPLTLLNLVKYIALQGKYSQRRPAPTGEPQIIPRRASCAHGIRPLAAARRRCWARRLAGHLCGRGAGLRFGAQQPVQLWHGQPLEAEEAGLQLRGGAKRALARQLARALLHSACGSESGGGCQNLTSVLRYVLQLG